MPVAEIEALALRRQKLALRALHVDAGIDHVLDPRRMRGDDVIIVDGILDEQLPVGLDVIFPQAQPRGVQGQGQAALFAAQGRRRHERRKTLMPLATLTDQAAWRED